jgi:hypothetical protein
MPGIEQLSLALGGPQLIPDDPVGDSRLSPTADPGSYVNLSRGLFPLGPVEVITVMSTEPDPAGDVTVMELPDVDGGIGTTVLPKSTANAPRKPLP